jgi:hypothetical protein
MISADWGLAPPLEAPANPELDPPTAPRISQDELSVMNTLGRSTDMLGPGAAEPPANGGCALEGVFAAGKV